MARSFLLLLALNVAIVFGASSHGFGDAIDWVTLDEAKAATKPIMLVIHKSWCGACKALRPKFAASSEIADLSRGFSMVNTEDDEEPQGEEYSPDGGYIPRILFLNEHGVMKDVINTGGSAQHKYFYPEPAAIVKSMNKVLAAAAKADEEL